MLHLKPQVKRRNNTMGSIFKVLGGLGLIGIVIGFVIIVVLWPLIAVWALNTLFGLGIAYNFWNWLAALILISIFNVRVNTKKE